MLTHWTHHWVDEGHYGRHLTDELQRRQSHNVIGPRLHLFNCYVIGLTWNMEWCTNHSWPEPNREWKNNLSCSMFGPLGMLMYIQGSSCAMVRLDTSGHNTAYLALNIASPSWCPLIRQISCKTTRHKREWCGNTANWTRLLLLTWLGCHNPVITTICQVMESVRRSFIGCTKPTRLSTSQDAEVRMALLPVKKQTKMWCLRVDSFMRRA